MYILLTWKNFYVNLEKVTSYFKSNLSSNYDGLVCDEEGMKVMFKNTIEESDSSAVSSYWDSATAATFQPTLEEVISKKVNEASIFGNSIIAKAIVENVSMGITQAGKTKIVADTFDNLQYYLKTGSLYAAIDEIDRLIAAGVDPNLSPFVTEARLLSYKSQILAYVSS